MSPEAWRGSCILCGVGEAMDHRKCWDCYMADHPRQANEPTTCTCARPGRAARLMGECFYCHRLIVEVQP